MEEIIQKINLERLIYTIIFILVSILVYKFFAAIVRHRLKIGKHNKSRDTYFALFSSIIRYAYIVLVAICALQINGVNVSSLLAGVSIISAVLGLALQDTLKGAIRGFSLASEDYYKVGDYVKINDMSGTVVHLGIRSTKLRDGLTGNIITIANSEINKAEVSADLINVDIPLPYELKLSKAESIMEEIVMRAKAENTDKLIECEYRGVSELASSSINYRIYAKCSDDRIQIKRNIYHAALAVLEEYKISVPYPQLDVHQK